ncbi:serine/threonine-protein kinase [Thalassotalea marina]|uniref:Protein kinase domain-containing protein n=1 Tax=Thalassotalea marina TaxID=1673741 RepID=A0A919ENZ4_9GAMM|nr:serine/threonine-protein kinase [Thalassotalea marina]GHG07972.1 hypothetical protein GCM10017161_42210 [Thalassotalea marina]
MKANLNASKRNITISDILDEIEFLPQHEIHKYLEEKYKDNSILVKTVKRIMDIDSAGKESYTSIIRHQSACLLKHFNPESYIGKVFGEWVAERVIHVTAKSAVYQASPADKTYSQKAAIKITLPTFEVLMGSENTSMQAHYISNLKHPNIVEGYGKGQLNNGVSYVIMEYLTNTNIVQHCSQNTLSSSQIFNLFIEICSAVEHMHRLGCVHCDLKPANIFMSVNNIPKIIDFDLSLATNKKLHENFSYNNVKGHTRKYAAPELLNGKGISSPLSDVYSLGVVFAEMLTGLFDIQLSSIPEKLQNKFKGYGRLKELTSIIEKATSKKSEDRYHSVKEMRQDVSRLMSRQSITTSYLKKASFSYKANFTIRKYYKSISFITIIVIALFIGMYTYVKNNNETKEYLSLLVANSSPTLLEGNSRLLRKAQEVYESTYLIKANHYEQLILYGDIFYSRGNGKQAEKFYRKAVDLYPNLMDDKRINATTKLAEAIFSQGRRVDANQVIYPYGESIFTDRVTSPYLIKMLLVALEINNRFFRNTVFSIFDEKNQGKHYDILSNIGDVDFPEAMKQSIEDEVVLAKIKAKYYSFSGDIVSITVNISEDKFLTEIKPFLLECAKELKKIVQQDFVSGSEITPLKPEIYLWLSRCESEAGNDSEAMVYHNLGIQLTERIYGHNHQKTAHAYDVGYSVYRNKYPIKAREMVLASIKIRRWLLKTGRGSDSLRLFSHMLLFDSYVYEGEIQKTFSLLDEAWEIYSSFKNPTLIDDDLIATMFAYFAEEFYYLYKPTEYRETYLRYHKIFKKLDPDINYTHFDGMTASHEIAENIENQIINIINENDYVNLSPSEIHTSAGSYGFTQIRVLAIECLKYKECDIEARKKDLQLADEKIFYGDIKFQDKSTDLLSRLLSTYAWIKYKDLERANTQLVIAEDIAKRNKANNELNDIVKNLRKEITKQEGGLSSL